MPRMRLTLACSKRLLTFSFCYGNCSNLTCGKRPGNLGSRCVCRHALKEQEMNSSVKTLPSKLQQCQPGPNSEPEVLPAGEALPAVCQEDEPGPTCHPRRPSQRRALEFSGKLAKETKQRKKTLLGQNKGTILLV